VQRQFVQLRNKIQRLHDFGKSSPGIPSFGLPAKPTPMKMASKSFSSFDTGILVPTSASQVMVTPNRESSAPPQDSPPAHLIIGDAISIESAGNGFFSKISTVWPSCANSAAQPRPAGPLPITASVCRIFCRSREHGNLFLRDIIRRVTLQPSDFHRVALAIEHHASASHKTCVGQTRAQLAPRMFALRIARAEPVGFPFAIFLMNDGISMPVGTTECRARQNKTNSGLLQ